MWMNRCTLIMLVEQCAQMTVQGSLPSLFYVCFSEMLVVFVKSASIDEQFISVLSCVELKASHNGRDSFCY